jgi:hypothetical protein
MKTVNELLEYAQKELINVPEGLDFLVRDLYKGYIWKQIHIKDRLLLGTLFLNFANNNLDLITPIEKTSSNQQKYLKVGRSVIK